MNIVCNEVDKNIENNANSDRIGCTYKLLMRDELRQRVFGMTETLARSNRRISSDVHPSNDGNSLKLLASDKTLKRDKKNNAQNNHA